MLISLSIPLKGLIRGETYVPSTVVFHSFRGYVWQVLERFRDTFWADFVGRFW